MQSSKPTPGPAAPAPKPSAHDSVRARLRPLLISLASAICLKATVLLLPPGVFDRLFCRIPAILAAGYFHAARDGSAFAFANGRAIAVTPECGGSDFFVLLCALAVWHICRVRKRFGPSLLLLPTAWGFTISVNALRIISSVSIGAAAAPFVPERLAGWIHLASGVIVFFPALLVGYYIIRNSIHD